MAKKKFDTTTRTESDALDRLLEKIRQICPADEFGFSDIAFEYFGECSPDYIAHFDDNNARAIVLQMICSEVSMIAEENGFDELFTLANYIDRLADDVDEK